MSLRVMQYAPTTIRNLADVIYVANMLSGGHFEWLMQDQPELPIELASIEEKYGYLRPEIEALAQEMRSSFA